MVPAITKNPDERVPRFAARRQGGATRPAAVYRWLCAGHEPGSKAMPSSAIFRRHAIFIVWPATAWLCYAALKSATSK